AGAVGHAEGERGGRVALLKPLQQGAGETAAPGRRGGAVEGTRCEHQEYLIDLPASRNKGAPGEPRPRRAAAEGIGTPGQPWPVPGSQGVVIFLVEISGQNTTRNPEKK